MTDSPAGKGEIKVDETKVETHSIPKARLDEEIGKRRELELKVQALEKAQKDSGDLNQIIADKVKEALGPTQRQLEAARLARTQGWQDEAAANLVLDYQAKGLDQTEAMAAAMSKKPELFQRPDDDRYRAGQHGSLPPATIGIPTKAELSYQDKVNVARNPTEVMELTVAAIKQQFDARRTTRR